MRWSHPLLSSINKSTLLLFSSAKILDWPHRKLHRAQIKPDIRHGEKSGQGQVRKPKCRVSRLHRESSACLSTGTSCSSALLSAQADSKSSSSVLLSAYRKHNDSSSPRAEPAKLSMRIIKMLCKGENRFVELCISVKVGDAEYRYTSDYTVL